MQELFESRDMDARPARHRCSHEGAFRRGTTLGLGQDVAQLTSPCSSGVDNSALTLKELQSCRTSRGASRKQSQYDSGIPWATNSFPANPGRRSGKALEAAA
ncbi:hypothetical protein MRB53_042287 [Persea americana]|nr:hypothetical protein MRB53_042287 [Persea americana]